MPTNNAIPMGVEEQVVHAALTVQENGGAVSMSAGGGVIKAVSPTVDLDRVAGGVQITVKDVRGSQSETVLDGPKGDKGDKGDPGNFSLDQLLVTDSASGAVASFADGGDDLPLKALTVGIAPVQDLHGQDAPYPPGGGKNKWSGDATFSKTDADLNVEVSVALPAGTYNLSGVFTSGDTTNNDVTFRFRSGTSTIVYARPTANSGARTNTSFTLSSACDNVLVYGGHNVSASDKFAATYTNVMIESGSTATDYAPYANICPISGHTGVNVYHSGADTTDPTVYPITWETAAGTVYGGTLDVVNGVLTVDRASKDLGELTWSYSSANVYFTSEKSGFGMRETTDSAMICDRFKTVLNSATHNSFECWNASTSIRFMDTNYTDKDEFKAAMSSVQLVYELATPVTYQLSAQQINSLLGQNNIWGDDGGDTNVTYYADTKLYIEKRLAELQALILEN